MAGTSAVLSVLLVSRSPLYREGLRELLRGTSFSIWGEFDCIEAALASNDPHEPPDIVLYHCCHPEVPARVTELRPVYPCAKLVVLVERLDVPQLTEALQGGVGGYVCSDIMPQALLHSLQLVIDGEIVLPTDLAAHIISNLWYCAPGKGNGERRATGERGALSRRETMILRGLVSGCSNKVIAKELNLAEGTIKVHLRAILRKIRVENRTQAAVWALNNGLASGVGHPLLEHVPLVHRQALSSPRRGSKPAVPDPGRI